MALVRRERRVRLDAFYEVQQEVGGGRQEGGFKRRERRRWFHTPPTTRRGKLALGILYIFTYSGHLPSRDGVMRPRISIGNRNGFSLDDISLLICCYYLFALLHHVVAVVIGKIFFVGS